MTIKLLDHLPKYYKKSKVISDITSVQDKKLQEFVDKIQEVANQFFIDTATSGFTLERWEKELGIPLSSNKDESYRRSVIKSKIRGTGTVTVGLLKNVAQSFEKGLIDVMEETELFRFRIKFIDTLGAPPNFDDLKNAIDEIKPAHLEVVYEFKYLTINQGQQLTINEIQARPLTDFSPFIPII